MKQYYLYNAETLLFESTNFYEIQPNNSVDFPPTVNVKFAKVNLEKSEWEYYNPTNEIDKDEIPFEVPLWAMRTVLKQSGLFQVIIDVIETLEEPTRTIALDFLEYGNFVERKSNTVILIQSISQMTDEQVDQLFIEANKLKL